MRRDVHRALIVGLPFLVLFGLVKVAAPAISRWKRLAAAGESYEVRRSSGRAAAVYEVYVRRARSADEVGRAVAAVDEFMGAALASDLRPLLRAAERPVKLLLFDSREDFLSYGSIVYHKLLERNDGFYSPETRDLGLVRGGDGFDVDGLRHEATHFLFDPPPGRSLSPWLAEGLACHFEAAPPRRDEAALAPPAERARLDRYRIEARKLLERGPLGLAEVFAARQDAFAGEDNARFYALAAATVGYFLERADPEVRGRFLKHLAAERDGAAERGPAGVEKSLGADTARIEAWVGEWLRE